MKMKKAKRLFALSLALCMLFCGAPFSFAKEEPAVECNHEWNWDEGKVLNPDAKCGELRKTEYTCLICGAKNVEENEIEHDWDYASEKLLDPDVTCGEEYRMEYTCVRCGKKTIEKRTLEHTMDDGVIVSEPASCRDKGTIEHTCIRCGAKENTYFEGPHKMANGTVTVEPTADAPGEISWTCALCGAEGNYSYGLPVDSIIVTVQNELYENISGSVSGYRLVSSYSDPDDGWNGSSAWDQYEEYGYFRYDLFKAGLKVTLKLKNGKTITVDDPYETDEPNEIYLEDGYRILLEDGQSVATQWKPGRHTVKAVAYRGIYEKMCEATFTVTLLENPISAVTAEYVPAIPEDFANYCQQSWREIPDPDPIRTMFMEKSEYPNRNPLLLHTRLTVTYRDGSTEQVFASRKNANSFFVNKVEKTAEGYLITAIYCGFPLSYTVPFVEKGTLPEKQGTMSEDTIPLEWKSVELPADFAGWNHAGSPVSNGKTVAFIYSDTDWNKCVAVLDETKTLRTKRLSDILKKSVKGEFGIQNADLSCVNGKFFLSVTFENGTHKAANGWADNVIFVSDDLKTFTELKLPALPADRVSYTYYSAEVYAFGDRFLIAKRQFEEKNGEINWSRVHLTVTVSADLKTWSAPCSPDEIESNCHGGSRVTVLGTTARGVLLGSYSITEATVVSYLEGVYYTTDFQTFVPVAEALSGEADVYFMGSRDDIGLVNLVALENNGAVNLAENPNPKRYSVSLLQFHEDTGKTTERACYPGTILSLTATGDRMMDLSIEIADGSADYLFTNSGLAVERVRMPYAVGDVQSRLAFSDDKNGKTYSVTIDLLKDNGGLLFTADHFNYVYRLSMPEISPDANGDREIKRTVRTEDDVLLFADRIYYSDSSAFDNYLKRDYSGVLDRFSGDISGDGMVTAEDARLALRAAVRLETYVADSAEALAADVNNDGTIAAEDARYILRAAVGLENLSHIA